jgi:ribosomal protein L16 Arg81 hydroxylase
MDKYYYYPQSIEFSYNLYDYMRYFYDHPKDITMWNDLKENLNLVKMEERPSTPDFAKKILKELKTTFYKNKISLHSFSGFTNTSKSFDIHRDTMDILYLQVIGEIEWSIWESKLDQRIINSDEGKCIFKEVFRPGDMIWVSRGTFHHVKPLSPRVGFSFGVEGPDPSTYVNAGIPYGNK